MGAVWRCSAYWPNLLLKVMAGDLLHAQTQYFYDPGRYGNQQETLKPLVQVLSNLLSNSPLVGSAIHQEAGNITSSLSQSGSSIMNFLNEPADNVSMPKAGLYVLFFDERFQFVTAEFKQIEQEGNQCEPLVLQSIQVPQNGYAMVLVANQQENALVLFDDLKVNHERGRLLEESHYYPDGLKMAAICARSMGKLPNRYGYQGDYSEEDGETGYQEFDLRMYDPQIGRWISPDPYDEFASPYVGMGNDPVNNVDPDGELVGSSLLDVVVTSTAHSSSILSSSLLSISSSFLNALSANVGDGDGDDKKNINNGFKNGSARELEPIVLKPTSRIKYPTDEEFIIDQLITGKVVPGLKTWMNESFDRHIPIRAKGVPIGPTVWQKPGVGIEPLEQVEPFRMPSPGPVGTGAMTLIAILIPTPTGTGADKVPTPITLPDPRRYPFPVILPYDGHGNSKSNTNDHFVYRFTYTPAPGQSPVLKYGIADRTRYDLRRPERQKPRLKLLYGESVDYKIIVDHINRQGALTFEEMLVRRHELRWGAKPRAQTRP